MLGMNEVNKYSIGIKLIFFKIKVYILSEEGLIHN
jgi:hypothetical protein